MPCYLGSYMYYQCTSIIIIIMLTTSKKIHMYHACMQLD